MTERISIERDGADRARSALEHCVTGGGVAIFPADTLYGLACDPLNAAAIERIHALKGRDEGKPSRGDVFLAADHARARLLARAPNAGRRSARCFRGR